MKKGVLEKNIHVETFNGETFDRPVLKKLEEQLVSGDKLYVVHIDRLGRNLTEMILFVDTLKKRGVSLVALNIPETEDSAMQLLFLTLFGWLAQYETSRRRERQMAGIAKAKLNPKK